jgi:FkbM family methyltransferase
VVTDRSGGHLTFFVNVGGEGISSVSRRWIEDFVLGFFGPDVQPTIREVKVLAITLNDRLEQNGVEKIDFLSMDIEGHEPAALAGFDIERFAPELVCIEASGKLEVILGCFTQHGYERIDRYLEFDVMNWYFQPRPER